MYIYIYLIIVLFLGIMINLFIIDSRLLIEWVIFRIDSMIIEISILVYWIIHKFSLKYNIITTTIIDLLSNLDANVLEIVVSQSTPRSALRK